MGFERALAEDGPKGCEARRQQQQQQQQRPFLPPESKALATHEPELCGAVQHSRDWILRATQAYFCNTVHSLQQPLGRVWSSSGASTQCGQPEGKARQTCPCRVLGTLHGGHASQLCADCTPWDLTVICPNSKLYYFESRHDLSEVHNFTLSLMLHTRQEVCCVCMDFRG